jgi:O-antigen/teichoic acid export membrane protein
MTNATAAWVRRSFWAVADQALFAGANFVLSVITARWLSRTEYGAFAVAYAVFLLVGAFHTALLTEPMLVFGSSRYRERLGRYVLMLTRFHWIFSIGGSLLLAVGALWMELRGPGVLVESLFATAVSTPPILYLWLRRRVCYVRLAPRQAAIGGTIYLSASLTIVYITNLLGLLTPGRAVMIMGASSVMAVLGMGSVLEGESGRIDRALMTEGLRDHWRYGRWAIVATTLAWIPGNIGYILLPLWLGLEAPGAMRALMNLALPMLHFNTALGSLLVPIFAEKRHGGDFDRTLIRVSSAMGCIAIVYWVGLAVLGAWILRWAYGGQYVEYAGWLWMVGALPTSAGIVTVTSSALRALELPHQIALVYAAVAVGAMTAGAVLIAWQGVAGAIVGLFASSSLTAAGMSFLLVRARAGQEYQPAC